MFKDILRRPKVEDRYVLNRSCDRPDWMSILDEFSQVVFRDALNLWPVDVGRTKRDFDLVSPELLFVESAWNGNRGAWLYLVCKGTYEKPQLGQLVKQCRQAGIPTVFWNKEDPVHYEDFCETAELFDYVFTSDRDLVPVYSAMPNVKEAHLLQFCANTAIHNPRQVDGYREGDICFAGQYFTHKYPERRQQMEVLFPAAARFDFTIFSRFIDGDERYLFPKEYERWIKGSLPYSKMVDEYKRHQIFLNVNSVVTSSSMCARRVFELTAAKTIVVSCPSEAIANVYQRDEVPFVENSYEASELFTELLRDHRRRREIAQAAWRRTVRTHTALDRVAAIRRIVLGEDAGIQKIRLIIRSVEGEFGESLLDEIFNQSLFRTPVINEVYLVSDSRKNHSQKLRDIEFSFIPETYLSEHGSNADETRIETFVAEVSNDYSYGPYYLEDLYLQLTKVGPEHVVSKADCNLQDLGPGDEEKACSSVRRGLWMADRFSSLGRFFLGVENPNFDPFRDSLDEVYITDPMNYGKADR